MASYLVRAQAKGAAPSHSQQQVIQVIRAGLPFKELEALRSRLGLAMDKLARKIGLSRATLHRRKAEGRLAAGESDHVLRFARILRLAIGVFEDEDYARRWLTSPQHGLGGAIPLDYAETEVGAHEVENLLGRIEYGVY